MMPVDTVAIADSKEVEAFNSSEVLHTDIAILIGLVLVRDVAMSRPNSQLLHYVMNLLTIIMTAILCLLLLKMIHLAILINGILELVLDTWLSNDRRSTVVCLRRIIPTKVRALWILAHLRFGFPVSLA
jgi:hypothetical protein